LTSHHYLSDPTKQVAPAVQALVQPTQTLVDRIALMFVMNRLADHLIDNAYFQDVIKYAQSHPEEELESRMQIPKYQAQMAEEVEAKMKTILEGKFVTILTDGGKDKAQDRVNTHQNTHQNTKQTHMNFLHFQKRKLL